MTENPYCNFQYREVTVRFLIPPPCLFYGGPPPSIFTCIGFYFVRTSKEKQKVILQLEILSIYHLLCYKLNLGAERNLYNIESTCRVCVCYNGPVYNIIGTNMF